MPVPTFYDTIQSNPLVRRMTASRAALETTYQRDYCRAHLRGTLAALGVTGTTPQTAPVKSRDVSADDPLNTARKKLWSTTYIDAYCSPHPKIVPAGVRLPFYDPITYPPGLFPRIASDAAATRSRSAKTTFPFSEYKGTTFSRGTTVATLTSDPRWSRFDPNAT
jgi:hypothetical protein